MENVLRPLSLLLPIFFMLSCLNPTSPSKGNLQGNILSEIDSSGISGVTVVLQEKETDEKHNLLSDASGHFSFSNIGGGNYSIMADIPNYIDDTTAILFNPSTSTIYNIFKTIDYSGTWKDSTSDSENISFTVIYKNQLKIISVYNGNDSMVFSGNGIWYKCPTKSGTLVSFDNLLPSISRGTFWLGNLTNIGSDFRYNIFGTFLTDSTATIQFTGGCDANQENWTLKKVK